MRSYGWLAVVLGLIATPTFAGSEADAESAIRTALTTWMEDFNAGRADAACALFASDLRFDFRGSPERGYKEMCDQLHRALSDKSRQFSYALQIKEVLAWGDTAIVRLVWRLTVRAAGASAGATSEEPGLDVFRRQADGSWKIVRYMAYETAP